MREDNGGTDIEANVAGQQVYIRNLKNVHTLLAVLILVVVSLTAILQWRHMDDVRVAGEQSVGAIKEQTNVIRDYVNIGREQNCLLRFPENDRRQYAEHCARWTGTYTTPVR